MKLRGFAAGIALATALVGALVGAPGVANAADDPGWLPVGTACGVQGGAGRVCAYLEQAQPASTKRYRFHLALTPNSGSWIQPTRYGIGFVEAGDSGSWCRDSDGIDVDCTRQTAAWDSGWIESSGPFLLSSSYTTAAGSYTLYLGDTGWITMTSKCAKYGTGTVCATLQGRVYAIGSGESYSYPFSAQAQYTPLTGKSLTPNSVTVTADASSSTTNLCAPSCTARTAAWTSPRTTVSDYPDAPLQTISAATTFTDTTGKHTVTATF